MSTQDKNMLPSGEAVSANPVPEQHSLLIPRRTVLKAGVVGVAGLAIGTTVNLVPSLAQEVSAAPTRILKIGAVVSPPTTNPSTGVIELAYPPRNIGPDGVIEKARILNLMGANSVRIAVYFSNQGPWFTPEQLDTLIGLNSKTTGSIRTEVFLTSKETLGEGTADVIDQFIWVKDYVNRVNGITSGISFIFEIGNEPNEPHLTTPKFPDPNVARQRALTWLQYLNNTANNNPGAFPANLYWAVNMPSNNADPSYFNAFTANDPMFGGSVLKPANQNRYYMVTTHVYGAHSYEPGDVEAPYKVTDWVRSAADAQGNSSLSIRFSETGVYEPYPPRPREELYYDLIATKPYQSIGGTGNSSTFGDGDSSVTTACFFSTPPIAPLPPPNQNDKGERPYQIFRPEAKALGRLLPLYEDFPSDADKADHLHEMSGLAITRGFGDRHYLPNNPITREQMASLICRSIPSDEGSMPGLGPNTWANESHLNQNPFADINSADPSHRENIQTLRYYEVTNGYSDNTFDPTGSVINAQTVSFITRALVKKGYWTLDPDDPSYMPNTFSNSNFTGHRIDAVRYRNRRLFIPEARDSTDWWGALTTRLLFSEILFFALDTVFAIVDPGYLRRR